MISNVGATAATADSAPSTMLWTGRILSGLLVLFLLFDAVGKIFKADNSVKGTVDLGYPESTVFWIGLVLLVCTVLYVIPRTAFFGAILLTGYLGGAVATQVRLEDAWLLMPAVLAVLVWVGLALRDTQLREFATR